MKHYELFYLITGNVPENELEPVQKEITSWISELKGNTTQQEAWGRKKLAYPINKEKHGYYFVLEFDAEASAIDELNKKLKLHKSVARYLLIHKKPMSEKQIKMAEQAEKRAQARVAAKAAESAKEKVGAPITKKQDKAPLESDESKIKLDDLDKKLDELLDQDIVN